jgi:imidazoleglycerol phosphate dehydratase HisB
VDSKKKTTKRASGRTVTSPGRAAAVARKTKETDIALELNLDGTGKVSVSTGLGFLDHMLTALAHHARLDLTLTCRGDLHIDDHHTAEDVAIALGKAIDQALGDRAGIVRFGYAYAPLDEALARAVVDLSGRPSPNIHLRLRRGKIGEVAAENLTHVLESLAVHLRASIHVDVLRGDNEHHKAEAAFKALALALRHALARDGSNEIRSTKGVL